VPCPGRGARSGFRPGGARRSGGGARALWRAGPGHALTRSGAHAAPRRAAPRRPPQISTLEPATHAYACWEGMPRTAKVALGALFAKASTLQVGQEGGTGGGGRTGGGSRFSSAQLLASRQGRQQ
jgi:hypothetical protein